MDSLKAYRELVSEEMPAIFVLIDRFSGILESNQDYKDVFVRLFSEGPSKGIYFVYTGVNNTGVPYKLTANVSGAISFMQSDRSEYSTLIGHFLVLKIGSEMPFFFCAPFSSTTATRKHPTMTARKMTT